MSLAESIVNLTQAGKKAARMVANLSTNTKNQTLLAMAEALLERKAYIQAENQEDLNAGRARGLSAALLDRLTLSDKVIKAMVDGLREVAALPDPVGEIAELQRRPSGIMVGRMRVPLGVIGMIYESRPNVTVDASALCLKAGNAVILRGGSEALRSNLALGRILQDCLAAAKIDPAAIQVVPTSDREAITWLLRQEEDLDLIIPRGGEGLIRFVAENSRIPVLKHDQGVCHLFVDAGADLSMAKRITLNGKTQRPGVCNALEALLVHQELAPELLPALGESLNAAGVEIRGCPQTLALIPTIGKPAGPQDWGKEFLDLILAIKVVADLDEAMAHIERYGSRHTEAIITNNHRHAMRFLREVDASSVMINASTRFSDGGQYGLGAEIGISTSKLHAYGPMGLRELTTRKFIVYGEGQIRE